MDPALQTEHFAGLVDRSRAPKAPARKIWLPLMGRVYHLQKAHPDAGEFRIWSLLAQPDVGVRTVGRVMALNKLVHDDIPHVPKQGGSKFQGSAPTTRRVPSSPGSSTAASWISGLTASSGGA